MVGSGWKIFVWQLISVFALKNFYYAFDTQLAENETISYMFLLVFDYCSNDQWQFCNFLNKLTGGILVIKHTTLFLFLTCSTAMKPQLLQTHLLRRIPFASSMNLSTTQIADEGRCSEDRWGEARRSACRWITSKQLLLSLSLSLNESLNSSSLSMNLSIRQAAAAGIDLQRKVCRVSLSLLSCHCVWSLS